MGNRSLLSELCLFFLVRWGEMTIFVPYKQTRMEVLVFSGVNKKEDKDGTERRKWRC